MRKLLLCLLLLPLTSRAEWLEYAPERFVPFAGGGGYSRNLYDWWISNTGQPCPLYQNGIQIDDEGGTNDIGLGLAWIIQPSGVPIGVVDANNPHGQRVAALASKVSRSEVFLSKSPRLYPEDVALAISNFVSVGIQIVVVTTGTGLNTSVSNACRYAQDRHALVFCAVPNAGVDIDVTPDYPSSWASTIRSIVPITSTDMNGNLYAPNAAAWGWWVVGAPGRNIIANDVYTSGTSLATPIAAGVMSLFMAKYPGWTSREYRAKLRDSCRPATGINRIDALNLLN